MPEWPERLFDLIFFPAMDEKLDELARLAEDEEWEYQNSNDSHHKPILFNYLQCTYQRLREEDKLVISDEGQAIIFNTGLVTGNQEPLFCYATTNRNQNAHQNWHFSAWCRRGEYDLIRFSQLPEMAHYFDDPSALVFDTRKELRTNVEHIVAENKARFPEPYRSMDDYTVQTFLKGAIDNVKERVKRNYKTAIPQYYRSRVQLLLPLCLRKPNIADLAIVVEDHGAFYRASTCLTLDMAYNNARQLARPDRDWLLP
jgi:hypothetical protein